MPDISMCLNKTCPLRKMCYRFMAEPNEHRQSYADFKPIYGPKDVVTCHNFMAVKK